jgi:uncharacterized protein YuzE
MIKVTYDKEVDAAYVYLVEIGPGEVVKTYPCNPLEVNGEINLDFNKDGQLTGIEVLDASKKLPKDILEHAESSY